MSCIARALQIYMKRTPRLRTTIFGLLKKLSPLGFEPLTLGAVESDLATA